MTADKLRVRRRRGILLGLGLAGLAAGPAKADLTQLALEDLMAIEITSVAKKKQSLMEAGAAIHVITREDIRRSGMTSIPELLRLVPGLQVAQIDGSKWAITARGFNGRWSNKLLVLMDGRTLYTPLFSGVYWDVQDTLLEDVERIEVIRGPGGTLWGSNAVNGVINIITRNSHDTQGGLLTAMAGTEEGGVALRYGGKFADNGAYRVFAKLSDHQAFDSVAGGEAHDAWGLRRAGFRADWSSGSGDKLTLLGNAYRGEAEQSVGFLQNMYTSTVFAADEADLSGANLLLRWRHQDGRDSDWELQAYVDRVERDDLTLDQTIETYDLEFQRRFRFSPRQEITWGLGYRHIEDRMDNSFTVSFSPASYSQDLYNLFVQDEIQLREDLRLTLGTKVEQNDYTGVEWQPSLRLFWQLAQSHALWGAVSRAVRTPSRSDTDIRLNVQAFPSPFDPDGPGPLSAGDPVLVSIFGSDDVVAEELLSFELGYRGRPAKGVSLDVATFYNRYDNLTTSEAGMSVEGSPLPTHAVLSSTFDNQAYGHSYGVELGMNWQVSPTWRLYAGYTWLKVDVDLDPGSTDANKVADRELSSPTHQLQLRSLWDVRSDLDLDLGLYYVDDVRVRSAAGWEQVPSYVRLDARLAWRPRKDLELSLVGQNLLDDRHPEFATTDVTTSEVPRSLYGKLQLRF